MSTYFWDSSTSSNVVSLDKLIWLPVSYIIEVESEIISTWWWSETFRRKNNGPNQVKLLIAAPPRHSHFSYVYFWYLTSTINWEPYSTIQSRNFRFWLPQPPLPSNNGWISNCNGDDGLISIRQRHSRRGTTTNCLYYNFYLLKVMVCNQCKEGNFKPAKIYL